jgi:integrase
VTPILLTFSQVSTKYLEDCQAHFQKNTWRQKAFVYRNFLTFIKKDPPAEGISKQIFVEYLKNRRNKDGNCAANRYLREFNALYNWAIQNEFVYKNSCINIKKYPESLRVKYVPSEKDINKVIMAADKDDMDLIMTLYHTAGRISEILNMIWEDVNFDQKWVKLWTRKRKGGELQEDKIAMNDTLYHLLKHRWINREKSTQYIFHDRNGSKLTYLYVIMSHQF